MRNCALLLLAILTTASATAQDGWLKVQSLTPGTALQITTDHRKFNCSLVAVTGDGLTCGKASVSRAEVQKVRTIRRGKSTAIYAAVGIGIGAGVGAGVGAAVNSSDKGSLFHVSGGKATGVGAAVGGVIGGISGAFIGLGTNLFGTTVFKR